MYFLVISFLLVVFFPLILGFSLVKIRNPVWKNRFSYLVAIVFTGAYWFWESKASGNIRVDLLVIYPLLFLSYVVLFWHKIRWWSFLLALLISCINFYFFSQSYSWFGKYPG